ncbi:hypothetical protein LOC67_01730 [Stieleria sp. JC731]|uniref:hypothetical protein n=1 Tax=Pirellulaceae TaxID=2691357 RepID=UPI001E60BF7C|nr:hypothetical protein [Stieleria sp. JC731]MCC9599263.1 hypothetical protein [Stieleria sp. JC731]
MKSSLAMTISTSLASAKSNWLSSFVVLLCCGALCGCGQLAYRLDRRPPTQYIPNPLELPPANDAFVWSQVIDTVDDYFRIAREQPVQNSPQMVLDGSVETSYQIGASMSEFWRKDSTAGFEALHSTLQSVRRKASVIVRPRGAGYTVEVVVLKDLEDTDSTQFSTETTASRRHDGTIVRQADVPVGGQGSVPQTLGWISLGRDTSLEQRILRDIFERVTEKDGRRSHL